MILDKIAAYTRLRIEEAKKELSPDEIRRLALSCKTDTGFPFEKVLKEPGIHYICEVKKASPSKGVIAEDFPYLKIAEEYEMAGASANTPRRTYCQWRKAQFKMPRIPGIPNTPA